MKVRPLSRRQIESLQRRDLPELFAGGREEDRIGKTFVKDWGMAAVLSLLGTYANHSLPKLIHKLHTIETGESLEQDELLEEYESLQRYQGFHRQALGHGGNVGGFISKLAAQAYGVAYDEPEERGSSREREGRRRDANGASDGGGEW